MSTDFPPLPSLDARMQAQERLSTILHARIEQLSQDMQASFSQLAAYQIQTEQRIAEQFAQVERNRAAMEDRILGAFQNLMDVVSEPKKDE
jgi:hypothetical protein